jgi:CheY-like chemotaxis protein
MNGLAVLRAADGIAALRAVEAYQPDLVLLDLMLPQIDGWAVLREFEARASTRDIPVVVITSSDTGLSLPHAKAVIQKPADPDYIVRVVTRHLPLAYA